MDPRETRKAEKEAARKKFLESEQKRREELGPKKEALITGLTNWFEENVTDDPFKNPDQVKLFHPWQLGDIFRSQYKFAHEDTDSFKPFRPIKNELFDQYSGEQTLKDTSHPVAVIELMPAEGFSAYNMNNSIIHKLQDLGVRAEVLVFNANSPQRYVSLEIYESEFDNVLQNLNKKIEKESKPSTTQSDKYSLLKKIMQDYNLFDDKKWKLGKGLLGMIVPDGIQAIRKSLNGVNEENAEKRYDDIFKIVSKIEIIPDEKYQEKKKPDRNILVNNLYKSLKNDFGIGPELDEKIEQGYGRKL